MGRGLLVRLLMQLRMIAASAAAVAASVVHLARDRGTSGHVVLVPGDEAPEFALAASDGRTYRLSEFRGREVVVLAWFPAAFTAGCTAECESIGVSRETLGRFAAAYFGASVDRPETNRRFAQSTGIGFPILSDPEKSTARAYGVLGPIGFPSRWTFYIGLDGRILAIDKDVRARTHGSAIEKTLGELRVPRRV